MSSESNIHLPAADKTAATPPAQVPPDDASILEQVREILVGAQLRQIDERFGRVEEMILMHNSRLLNLLDKRIAVVESLIEKQSAELARQQTETDGALQQLEEKLLAQGRALRSEFDELSITLKEQLSQLRETLDAETSALRQDTETHDRDLATLFQEMAARLLKTDGAG